MDQRIIDLYDQYTHGATSRREFLDRLARLAGGAAAAAAPRPPPPPDDPPAALVPAHAERLLTATGTWASGETRVSGYLARLRGGAKRPAVIVIHENRGLNAHIKDVARRFAVDGFLALAPDMLSSGGGTPADEDKAREMIGALDGAATLTGLAAAVPFLSSHAESTGRVGAVGFCWGGAMANQLAAAGTPLAAAVAYYGRQLPAADVPKVSAALMLHYAGLDQRVNAGIAEYEAALKAAGKAYELHMYDGANHAFNNDTNAARYDKAAADLAWGRTVAFLRARLGQ